MQGVSDALRAVPYKAVQIVADGVEAVAVGDDLQSAERLLLAAQAVDHLEIPHQIIHLRVVERFALADPRQVACNVDTLGEQIVPEPALELGVAVQSRDEVVDGVFDAVAAGVELLPDLLDVMRNIVCSDICIYDTVTSVSPMQSYEA